MVKLDGVVTSITYQNEDTGYLVLHLKTNSAQVPATCIGIMPTISAGESVSFQGDWEVHSRFGKQFNVKNYEIIRPTTQEGIAMLLGSGLISNLGPVRSKAILDKFGLQTLDILDKEPKRLAEVPGIGPKILQKIQQAWDRHHHLSRLMLFLQEFGVTVNMALKIYKVYGLQAQQRISENPYTLIDDVWGVGFVKADAIAQKMGFSHDSFKRIRAGLIYVLQESAGDGHSYFPYAKFVSSAVELLGVKEELVTYSIGHTVGSGQIVKDEDRIYLPIYYNTEIYIAQNMRSRLNSSKRVDNNIKQWLVDYQQKNSWKGDVIQLEAIETAIAQPVFLLTGGPGTGKTTILQVIVSFFREQHKVVALAAPTGRAAQRMGSLAGLVAKTIHRLLEFKGGASGYSFGKDEENPLDADVIVLDEVSMIDVLLMRSFIAAVKKGTQLIFVGDSNQLPSVGAGNVLADLISSGVIPHVHLTTIFRQAAASRIVTAAHEIISGTIPAFLNAKNDNCFFIVQEEPQDCVEMILNLVSHRLPARYNFNPISDIQVLAPMHKGLLGTQNLNGLLQKELNGRDRGLTRGQVVFYPGDKVMQIRNNYDLGVYNGDIGRVVDVAESSLEVNFDGNRVQYESKDLDELIPAYCISIHKSQGCEFKAVIIPLSTQHFIMLQRNLVYTALTRAKQLCIFVGSNKALSIAVKNDQALLRYSQLAQRLS
jgi:exodeoxyribonuclease V alpha subunit